MNHLKKELLDLINFKQEVDELLGPGKGNTRRCWNTAVHDDNTPSLSFSPSHGGWRCHSCGESGDLFTLHMKVNDVPFWESLKHYMQRYGLWDKVVDFSKSKFYKTKKKRFTTVKDKDLKSMMAANMPRWADKRNEQKLAFMYMRYGIELETLMRWKISLGNDGRVWIPIWAERSTFEDGRKISSNLPAFVNVRRHDCFRRKAQWVHVGDSEVEATREISRKMPAELNLNRLAMQDYGPWKPTWTDRSGKVVSQAGHGATYLYPAEVLLDNSMVYVVGGELKALLLNQLGVPAVTFTTGEGSIAESWLPYFIGKRVRIIMDADPEKDDKSRYPEGNPTNKKANRIGQVFADLGAHTEVMEWPEQVKKHMPEGGDVTDLLRLCEWNPDCLELMPWKTFERRLTEQEIKAIPIVNTTNQKEVKWDDAKVIGFHDLVDPRRLNEWVKVRALVSGLNETPYVVPAEVSAVCHAGMANMRPKCASCRLPDLNFRRTLRFSVESQVSMVGNLDNEKMIRQKMGIPRRCWEPELEVTPASVQVAVLTPTVEAGNSDLGERFEHRLSYLVGQDRIRVRENGTYDIKGQVIPDPKKGTFTLSASEWRDVDDDIFSHNPSPEMDAALRYATSGGAPEIKRDRLVGDIRDHVVKQIIGQDQMIEVVLLSYFMPFVFRLGGQIQERVCPSVMILGDTTVGKSTATNKIRRFMGAGRMYAANADPTHAGLIGGVMKLSNSKTSFHWGVLPTSHGALLALDEYNKLSFDTIGKLTNVISSGIAERLTVSGPRRTKSWVRMLYLANPRGERPLGSYSNPLDAAMQVCGTVQDLGRVDLVHVQHKLRDRTKYGRMLKPTTEHLYSKSVARYHLQWAWSRTTEHIKFDEPDHVFRVGLDLSDRFGGHAVLLPAQARFKLGRIAAAYATMLFSSNENHEVIVKSEHVDLAADLIRRCYTPYLNPYSRVQVGTLPTELVEVFAKVKRWKRLRMLANSDKWSSEDISSVFGTNVTEFLEVAQYEHGLISKRRGWYSPKNPDFCDHVNEYLSHRAREEAFKREANKRVR